MAHMFRSADMKYVKLFIKESNAEHIACALGKFGKLHLVDISSNPALQQEYKKRIQIATYWIKKCKKFRSALEEHNLQAPTPDVVRQEVTGLDPVQYVKEQLTQLEGTYAIQSLARNATLEKLSKSVLHSNVIQANRAYLPFEVSAYEREREDSSTSAGSYGSTGESTSLADLARPRQKEHELFSVTTTMTGAFVVPSEQPLQIERFKRMIYRIGRGNIQCWVNDIEEKLYSADKGEASKWCTFFLRFNHSKFLSRKVELVCKSLKATMFDLPTSDQAFQRLMHTLDASIMAERKILETTNRVRRAMMKVLLEDKDNKDSVPLVNYENVMEEEILTCAALLHAQMLPDSDLMELAGWLPHKELQAFQHALAQANLGSMEPTVCEIVDEHSDLYPKHPPPSLMHTNCFTAPFQGIVNTYGVPNYKEANPGLFTVITFPFLFAVMYGDIGHGFFLFCCGCILLYKQEELGKMQKRGEMNELVEMVYSARYVVTLMGFFATYVGFIYNDCMSNPIYLFGSRWKRDLTGDMVQDGVYPFGVDPMWYHTANQLTLFNSFKMKGAVIIGVTHMLFGVTLGLTNHIYFKDPLHAIFEFIPRFLFLACTFGYMCLTIIIKWTIHWENTSLAPNLITTTINMFLSPGNVPDDMLLYEGQAFVQLVLVLIAVVCLPVMLFAIPCITKYTHEQHEIEDDLRAAHELKTGRTTEHKKRDTRVDVTSSVSSGPVKCMFNPNDHSSADGHYSFSDHMIINGIHTIEFSLGCVSNTASYLRLWALSLAHAELAEVFWTKLAWEYGIGSGSLILAVVGVGAWIGATLAVLCLMDVLECFLHALRLHWVEFQNKFYRAEGYAFEPFVFPKNKQEQ